MPLSKIFQKCFGSVGSPPIDFEMSISKNLKGERKQEFSHIEVIVPHAHIRWNMTNIKEALVAQVDGLLVQHLSRDHLKSDKIP
jgi:hypothetical protein